MIEYAGSFKYEKDVPESKITETSTFEEFFPTRIFVMVTL